MDTANSTPSLKTLCLLGAMISLCLVLISCGGPSDSTANNKAPTVHDKLRAEALAQLNSKRYGPGAICDKIVDPSLSSIVYGTAVPAGGTTRFPAIVANYRGVCVKQYTGDRAPLDEWHVILALDELGEKVRCLKLGGQSTVNASVQSCDFKPEESTGISSGV